MSAILQSRLDAENGYPSSDPCLRKRSGARSRRLRSLALHVVVTVAGLLMLSPVALMFLASVKPSDDTTSLLTWPSRIAWGNYSTVFEQMGYARALSNTVLITGTSTALTVLFGAMAAYPIARVSRAWTRAVYGLFIAGLTVPVFVILTPLYLLLRDAALLDSYLGVIAVYTALNLPLAVFFFTGFLRSIPIEIEEAAVIDGCNTIQVFLRVVLPLLKPVTATLSIFVCLGVWNDLIVPLVVLNSPNKQTVITAAYAFIGQYGFSPAQLFPAVVLATMPLLLIFLLLQRHIVAGISVGAVK